jgi:methylamine dehydrogenase light chain
MSRIDALLERSARRAARGLSRRGFVARLGTFLAGGATLPLLPVSRALAQVAGAEQDPASCEYWRHCAIDGFLCSCCGGSHVACPPGTEMAPVTWIGTCRNPADGRDYVISYNDCCGKEACGRCFCHRNEGDKPVYVPARANDIDWCMGSVGVVYHSTVVLVLGAAAGREPG